MLPRERDGLAHLEKQLTRKRLEGQKLGIALAFDSKRADFAGISTCWRLSVSAVLHEAFVKVDEEERLAGWRVRWIRLCPYQFEGSAPRPT